MSLPNSRTKKLLVIGHRWPEPEATAAGRRMLGLLEGFLGQGYQIIFGCAATPGNYALPLEPLGIETIRLSINDPAFDRFLASNPFDIVLFDRFITEEQFGWRVRDCLPESTLILDTEDLHSLRHSREKAVREAKAWSVEDWTLDPLFNREVASILRCDLSLLVSERERDLLISQLPLLEGKLLYLPFLMKPGPKGQQPGYQERMGFVFVGTGLHRPNVDAIEQLKFEVWPALSRKLPRAVLRVYGAYLPERILGLHNAPERFEVCGWAPSLAPVFGSARLQLAPIRFGAGIKGKILSALQFGLPTLGSPISLEGIYAGSSPEEFLAQTPGEFIDKAVELHEDEGRWRSALQTQTSVAGPHFTDSFDLLTEALGQREAARERLPSDVILIQNLLRDQAFDRLRYLSKWIEAKNARED